MQSQQKDELLSGEVKFNQRVTYHSEFIFYQILPYFRKEWISLAILHPQNQPLDIAQKEAHYLEQDQQAASSIVIPKPGNKVIIEEGIEGKIIEKKYYITIKNIREVQLYCLDNINFFIPILFLERP